MASSITDVKVNGSPFCAGQSIVVSYTASKGRGSFDKSNFFTAQLSDASGSFSAPVDIGTLSSEKSGDINAIIPSGTATGTQYRIRVVSSSPVVTSDPNTLDLTINITPAAPDLVTSTPNTICALASSNLNATSPGNSISWYTTGIGGSAVGTSASGADFSVSPATTTNYYAEAFSVAGCTSPTRTMITVSVNPIPVITGTTPGSVCDNGTVTLAATASDGIINWYSDPTDGVIIGTGSSFTTPVISSNTTYYIDATANGCTTVTRTSVIATVNQLPSAPSVGTITQPTCTITTGSVVLNNLPGTGTWTLTRTPGGITTTGSETSTTITGLAPGTYTYTVTNASGCTSSTSSNVVINTALSSPSPPTVGTITQPTCTVPTGSVVLNNLPGTGTWTLSATPGGNTTTGSGTSTTIAGLAPGTYTFTVTDESGCTSPSSSNFSVNTVPESPSAPTPGTITQPTCSVPTGSVVLNNLPRTGTWTLTRTPGGTVTTGSGTRRTITELPPGTYTYTVTNAAGCTSSSSSNVVVNPAPSSPSPPAVGTITQPTCAVLTGIVVLNNLPGTGTWTLTRSPGGTTSTGSGTSTTITGLAPGTYTYTVTDESGCTSSSSSNVVINTAPSSPSPPTPGTITQPTCAVPTGSVVLNNLPGTDNWTLIMTPGGTATTGSGTNTSISGLAPGTYTFTVTNASGCTSSSSSNVVINAVPPSPSAPNIGTITQPTCVVSVGSVVLNSLPAQGTWTITISPGGTTTTGNGSNTTITGLLAGTTYSFRVTNSAGCISPSSNNVIIQPQPPIPAAPLVGAITATTCLLSTGSVVLNGLPDTGIWTLTRYPGGITTTGTGISATISGLPAGRYNYSVTNWSGCVSGSLSNDIIIPAPPPNPSAPVIGNISQPDCSVSTGSVSLSGLPAPGSWTITLNPGGNTTTDNGTTTTISGLAAGTYTFTVTNSNGCTSLLSANAVINPQPVTPSAPVVGNITQPTCTSPTGNVVLNSLPSGTWTLTLTPGDVTTTGSGPGTTISALAPGTYSFTVTNAAGCTSIPSGNVVINPQPPVPSTPAYSLDCSLGFGHAVVTVNTPVGSGLQYSIDGGAYQGSNVFAAVANGNHFLTVRNVEGCTMSAGVFEISCPCINQPALVLSATSGSTCGTAAVTVTGNTFGGTATGVTITHNGAGSLSPASTGTSPFSFTYFPASGDGGRTVVITVTTNNPLGMPCAAAVETYTLTVHANPAAPGLGTITNPTCTVETGSVILNGLPAAGTWTLTESPDGRITNGTGSSGSVSGLAAGTYTFRVTTEAGCLSPLSADAVINPQPQTPSAPVTGTITHPTCDVSTGSILLSGLPAQGNWIVTRIPGEVTTTGSGTGTTISTIPGGTYTFTVTNASGCTSPASGQAVVNVQPITPSAPSIGHITPPACVLATGSVTLSGLPASDTWTLTRYPGTVIIRGTGTGTNISGLATGIYNYTVTNIAGCISVPSANVIIPAQPPTPPVPVVDTIIQPTYTIPAGSVVLSGLIASGTWTITRLPERITTTGTGAGHSLVGLPGGRYTFTITNSSGCTSGESAEVIISTPGPPDLIITDPAAVCYPATVDLTEPGITSGSTTGITYSYWTDAEAKIEYNTPASATAGTYYIKATTVSGYFNIKPVKVTIDQKPVANAGPDQILYLQFSTTLDAEFDVTETGLWSLNSGFCEFTDPADPKTVVSKLAQKSNILLWTVTRGVCPPVTDTVIITVSDLEVPTLITPNGDQRNEYFEIQGFETLGKTELVVFDKRGVMVFKDSDYDNKWNGVDYNKKPLPDDTYFFVVKSSNGMIKKGFVVIRR